LLTPLSPVYNEAVNAQADTKGRRALPSVSRLLEHPAIDEALAQLPRPVVVEGLRAEIAAAREDMESGAPPPSVEVIIQRALSRARQAERPSLRRAVNATGIILHTGLGRAVLSKAARQAVMEAASGHNTLEVDMESGRRGSRRAHVEGLLRELTGAESAFAVNNNAGAVFLAVTALAAGREVVISRGELVEIGGSFRMPDIIRAGGATLVEVGTTNRTRLHDFEEAITERTGMLLRCHPSNFRLVGFTEEVPSADLARLGRAHGIPVLDDLGSGALLDTSALGAGPTTTLRAAVKSDCDVVTASGDKLLGGPQAGLILGRRKCVDCIARHPLARALRVDKLTLAALEATLRLYRDPERARREIPTLRYLARPLEELAQMASRLRDRIEAAAPGRFTLELIEEQSQVGGGSLPGENLPTVCVRLRCTELSEEELAARLRRNEPPVFARIKDGALLLDPRTLEEEEMEEIASAVYTAAR
jgi:L-seryl-tRNA(Ser) seleniumtransferase